MGGNSRFASRLRWWRQRRGLSQLALAHEAEISQRHASFLENGRTAPSREMVLRLAAALDLPFREQNALLLAAGFAPAWRETPLGAPELALVDRALDYMLMQQEPYPAFVVFGSVETSAPAGSPLRSRVFVIACSACRCSRASRVVYTRSPPRRTRSAPGS